MQKYHKKHDNVNYINKNYVLKPIYNDENECINDTLSKGIQRRREALERGEEGTKDDNCPTHESI